MPIIFILPGIMCFVLFKDTAPDNAYITMIKQLMPHGLLGLSIAALIASLVDTVSSSLNSFCTVFTLDVVPQFKVLDNNQQRRMGKWVTVLVALVGIGIAMLFSYSGKGFFDLTQGLVSILAPPLAVVFLWGVIWRGINGTAAEVVLYGGGLICLILGVCHVLNYPYRGFWPHFLMLSFYIFLALSLIIVLVSFLTKSNVNSELPTLFDGSNAKESGQSRSVWLTWAGLAFVMIMIYIYFN
ncbi:Sodium/glucose cotransporter [compost metagenome]